MRQLPGLLLACAALCGAGQAAAHATLVASTPADGAALAAAPAEIVVRFDEPVAPQPMRLVDDRGATVALPGAARAEGGTLRVPLPPLREGAYVFSWRAASADMHPVAGSIAFSVGSLAPSRWASGAATDAASSASGPSADLVAARLLRDLPLLIAAGVALFTATIAPFARQRAVLSVAALGAALAAIAELGLQGAALLGPDTSWWDGILAAAATRAGTSAAGIVLGLLLVLAGATMRYASSARAALLVGGLVAPISLCLTGHAASAQPGWLAPPLVACHALMAAFWIGSLVALLQMLRTQGAAAGLALRKFSAIAIPAVGLLLAAGGLFAWRQLRTLEAWRSSDYGAWVLLKVALLAALLVLAASNRFVLLPRLQRGHPGALPWLRRSLAGELVLVALVLAATSVLSRTPPHAPAPPAAVTVVLAGTAGYGGSLALTGRHTFAITLRDPQGRPLDAEEVELRIGNRQAGIAPLVRTPVRLGPGSFRHAGGELAFAGQWQLEVAGRVGEFERFRLGAEVALP